MPLNVFLQVEKIYKENITISFFVNTNLAYYQVCFFLMFLAWNLKNNHSNILHKLLRFLNHKTLPKPLICICGQSNSCSHAKLFLTAITVYESSQITFIKLYLISAFNLRRS